MKRLFNYIKKHLNTWDEVSADETLRLRNNVLIIALIVGCICPVTVIFITIEHDFITALPTIALVVFTAFIFFSQFFSPAYSPAAAAFFTALGFVMAAYLLWTGGVDGTGIMWIYVLPVAAAMMLPPRKIVIYNIVLLSIIWALLQTPLRDFSSHEYSDAARVSIPLSIVFVMVCSYMTELSRTNIHQKLAVATMQLRNSSFTDPLTGVYNRRALELHFGDVNKKALSLAFAMLDLDYFKNVNDNYGHDAGDKVLSRIAELTLENIPSDAYLYRWGGEEFLLVLKTDDPDETEKELNSLCEKIKNTPLIFEDGLHSSISLTVSIGGVSPNQDLTIRECIRLADRHLYEAKEKGRNRVVVR